MLAGTIELPPRFDRFVILGDVVALEYVLLTEPTIAGPHAGLFVVAAGVTFEYVLIVSRK